MLRSDTKKILSRYKIFCYLHLDEVDLVGNFMETVGFEKGASIMQQGYGGSGMYIIKKGSVLVSVKLPGDVSATVAKLSDSDAFGEITLIEGGAPSANVIATEDTECFFLDSKYFSVLKLGFPKVAYKISLAIMEMVCSRLRDINAKVGGKLSDIKLSSLSELRRVPNPEIVKTTKKDENFLRSLPAFSALTQAEMGRLLHYLKCHSYPRHSLIFEEGEVSDCCYIIIQGAIQVSLRKDTHLSKLGVLGPGNIFGHMSLIDKSPRSATCYAREPALLLRTPFEKIMMAYHKDRELFYKCFFAISTSLAATLRQADKLIIRLNVETHEHPDEDE